MNRKSVSIVQLNGHEQAKIDGVFSSISSGYPSRPFGTSEIRIQIMPLHFVLARPAFACRSLMMTDEQVTR